jgi:hypothetical protein
VLGDKEDRRFFRRFAAHQPYIAHRLQRAASFADLKLYALIVREHGYGESEMYVIASLQVNCLSNIPGDRTHIASETVSLAEDFDGAFVAFINNVDSHRQVSGRSLLRPIGIQDDFQRCDIETPVFAGCMSETRKAEDNQGCAQ